MAEPCTTDARDAANGAPAAPTLSVIVPTLNEATRIESLLAALQPLRAAGHEVLLVDGGSADTTITRARPLCDRILRCAPGRAGQQNHGAGAARGAMLWFVHADSQPSAELLRGWDALLDRGAAWGRFDVRLSGRGPAYRMIESAMNLRSRLTGICTGDQGLFCTRELFLRVGGFPAQPLMEDIELSRRLRALAQPCCSPLPLTTSARRWERGGVFRTVMLMWVLRAGYFLGISPWRLARFYAHTR